VKLCILIVGGPVFETQRIIRSIYLLKNRVKVKQNKARSDATYNDEAAVMP